MDNVLEVRNLRKNYSRFELQDVSFTVPEGCIAGFVGKQRCRPRQPPSEAS